MIGLRKSLILNNICNLHSSLHLHTHAHPLRTILNKNQVVTALKEQIVYHKDGLLVLNKPYGLGKITPPTQSETCQSPPNFERPLYFDELMPDIMSSFPQYSSLTIHKFPDRYHSGIMILAGTDEARNKIEKCKRRGKAEGVFDHTLIAISLGIPIFNNLETKVGITLQKEENKSPQLILLSKWSKRDVEKQRVKPIRIRHQVITSNSLATLSQASFSSFKSNIVRLFYATKLLSPLLGDNLFSGRVGEIMGKTVLMDPRSNTTQQFKKVPEEILQALELNRNESLVVPLFVHIAEVRLIRYHKGKDLILQAAMPDHFKWACEKLNLNSFLKLKHHDVL